MGVVVDLSEDKAISAVTSTPKDDKRTWLMGTWWDAHPSAGPADLQHETSVVEPGWRYFFLD